MKTKGVLKLIFTISFCLLIFMLVTYFYLSAMIDKQNTAADTKQSKIPYSTTPEDSGVLFIFPDQKGLLTYFEFSNNSIYAIPVDDCTGESIVYYGYPADYRIECDYPLIAGIIDNAGGVELERDEEILRYTGVQVVELLSYSADLRSDTLEITIGLFKSISQNGFSVSDMTYILSNCTHTNLTLPICFNWSDYIPKMTLTILE